MIDFNKLIKKTNKHFEQKVKDTIIGHADKVLDKNKLPSFSELQNIHKTAYNNVLKNANWENNVNGYLNDYLGNSINNSLMLGLATAVQNGDPNSVQAMEQNAMKSKGKNVGSGVLSYPIPGDDEIEKSPYMEIKGFKYEYDNNDVLGNMRAREGHTSDGKVTVNKTATIRLPLPGNLASGLSQQFEDYSSVFAKLVKANNGNVPTDDTGIMDQLTTLMNQSGDGFAHDLGAIAGMAAIFGIGSGQGVGGALTASLDESLKFIRVAGGFTVNPMQQTSYIGSNMRTHSFEFNMIPKNQLEAIACKQIIETLQYCSIGEKRTEIGGILMNFPSVWNVEFLNHNGKPINGMLMIPDSFLSDVNVTYSPSRAGFTVTRDNDPFAYVLNLTFKECQNLVRDDLSYLRQGGTLLDATKYPTSAKDKFDNVKTDLGGIPATTQSNNDDENAKPNPNASVAGTGGNWKPNREMTPEERAKREAALKDAGQAANPNYAGDAPLSDAELQRRSKANREGNMQTSKLEALGNRQNPEKKYKTPTLGGR